MSRSVRVGGTLRPVGGVDYDGPGRLRRRAVLEEVSVNSYNRYGFKSVWKARKS